MQEVLRQSRTGFIPFVSQKYAAGSSKRPPASLLSETSWYAADMERSLLFLAVLSLALSSGFLSGRQIALRAPSITFVSDTRPPVPTVQITGIRNGLLHGRILGSARFVLGSTVLTESGVFALEAGPLLHNEIAVVIPDGAQFVASKRGKNAYPVFSAAAEKLSPDNRIYFATESQALDAGYKLK